MNVAEVEREIGIPIDKWPGNCDGIAHAMIKAGLVPGGVSRYGHFRGPVHPDSMFYDHHSILGFSRHGWIEETSVIECEDCSYHTGFNYEYDAYDCELTLCGHDDPDVYIIDPTRWVFENTQPYIYDVLKDYEQEDEYDIGGNVLRAALRGPFPEYLPDDVQVYLWGKIDPAIRERLWSDIARQEGEIGPFNPLSLQQAVWFANLSPATLGLAARPLYMALIEMGHSAFIPIDNRRLVLE